MHSLLRFSSLITTTLIRIQELGVSVALILIYASIRIDDAIVVFALLRSLFLLLLVELERCLC